MLPVRIPDPGQPFVKKTPRDGDFGIFAHHVLIGHNQIILLHIKAGARAALRGNLNNGRAEELYDLLRVHAAILFPG